MKSVDRLGIANRFTAVLVLAAMLLLPRNHNVLAEPLSTTLSEWTVTIYGFAGTICAGDTYMLAVRWFPNDTGVDNLAPLAGPKAISVTAKLGTLDHETERAGAPSGMATFLYTAQKEGGEQITVKAFNQDLEVDATAAARFEVDKCKYRYELYAELYDDVVDGDVAIGYLLTYRSKGMLEAPDPNQPDVLEDNSQMIRFLLASTYFSAPHCVLVTTKPGQGMGYVDVKAKSDGSGVGLHVTISPPREAEWSIDNTIVCDGEPSTSGGAFPISSSADPWIEHTFPVGGGSYPVKIDILEETVANARGKGHIISYQATLKLERVVER
ncbi:MAG: hypothetical protein EHM39_01035 [Chloroflexi bacterium]|nr:MAG: hypothetical protein EHM39_01035 [Chloroflexota bacterium]